MIPIKINDYYLIFHILFVLFVSLMQNSHEPLYTLFFNFLLTPSSTIYYNSLLTQI